MKKSIIIFVMFFSAVSFGGCFGGDDESGSQTSTSGGEKVYENSTFSMVIPQDWEILEQSGFTSNVPSGTVLAVRNNIRSEVFTANLNIVKTVFKEAVEAQDFAKSTLTQAKNNLIGYEEIEMTGANVVSGEEELSGYILEFKGKKSASDPIVYFRQLVVVANEEEGYTLTAGFLPNEDETVVKYLNKMLDSFSLK